jgi:hypothetical protein
VAYRLEGTYFETCTCEFACPCSASNLAAPATYDCCRVLLAFHVDSGAVDGVDVAGKTVTLLADAPKQMTDGGWRVGVIVDEDTSEDQRAALVSVFGGEQGGPAALLSPLVGEILGVEYAPAEYADSGRMHSLRIGESIDVEVEDFAGAKEGSVMTLSGIGHPANSTLTLGRANRGRISAFGIEVDTSGKNAHAAPFSWDA